MLIEGVARTSGLSSQLNALTTAGGNSGLSFSQLLSEAQAGEEKTVAKTSDSSTEKLLKDLKEYIDKGSIVALREKILKSMGLTEEKLAAMPPEQQKAVESEIASRIKEFLTGQQEKEKTGEVSATGSGAYASVNRL